MKKIRIMLMGIVVLAAVGGALAFNAQKYGVQYCSAPNIAPPVVNALTDATNCVQQIFTSTTVINNGSGLKYITPAVGGQCIFAVGAKCTALYRKPE